MSKEPKNAVKTPVESDAEQDDGPIEEAAVAEPTPEIPAAPAKPATITFPEIGQRVTYISTPINQYEQDDDGQETKVQKIPHLPATLQRVDRNGFATLEVSNTNALTGASGVFPVNHVRYDPTGKKTRSWH